MDDEILEAQRDLVDRVEAAGWDVTDTEISVYRSPWEESDEPEATVTITARQLFPSAHDAENDDREDSPFRVR